MRPPYPLTERVEEALREAQRVAGEYAHEYVGTEHLLLGLWAETSGEVQALLRSEGIEPGAIPALVAQTVRRGKLPAAAARIRPYTSHARQALQVAGQAAAACGHKAVDVLHLMLALRTDESGIAGQVMAHVGLQSETLRQAIGGRSAH